MEYAGYAERWDEVVLRGDPEAGEGFVAFWLRDGLVVAGMNVNVWDVNQHVQELIRARRPVDLRALADAGTPLDSLVALSPRSVGKGSGELAYPATGGVIGCGLAVGGACGDPLRRCWPVGVCRSRFWSAFDRRGRRRCGPLGW